MFSLSIPAVLSFLSLFTFFKDFNNLRVGRSAVLLESVLPPKKSLKYPVYLNQSAKKTLE